ncbi:uncharacterized protein si:ch211-214p13.7 [Xyrichtys novacula]|uniref:Uncharacterized protein si:ch211-214p13.7 n=1 Tax=Xyrichtys novacula TaxID=13765 RepID=A0AAV1H0J7_XYRNO|nr:uncharacterized protein si:ch211-214p13.7 [Xyrichtys novacula]
MGACTSRLKKKGGGDSRADKNAKPNEDVTYASIDHSASTGSRRTRATTVDDCDYATVYVPQALQPQPVSESSSKGDCEDDYVLMS